MVSVRFTPQELAEVQASSDGKSLSGYLRNLALAHREQQDAGLIGQTVNSTWQSAFHGTYVTIQGRCYAGAAAS